MNSLKLSSKNLREWFDTQSLPLSLSRISVNTSFFLPHRMEQGDLGRVITYCTIKADWYALDSLDNQLFSQFLLSVAVQSCIESWYSIVYL